MRALHRFAVVASVLSLPTSALAQTAPPLGTASSFGVLAGSAVTNTGPTTVMASVGVDPGLAITGFPPGLVLGGTMHAGDATAALAQSDVRLAYEQLAGQACSSALTGQDLGGLTLTSGVYCFSSSAQLTGTLTLDAQGDPAAVFVFQIGSTLTTGSAASVRVINGGSSCNVFWQIGSSATLGTATTFSGTMVALTSVTLTTTAEVDGRVWARNGAVTLDSNRIAISCSAPSADAGVRDSAPSMDAGVMQADAAPPASAADAGSGAPDAAWRCDAAVGDAGIMCRPEQTKCRVGCVDLLWDSWNCGSCDSRCARGTKCTKGVCK